MRRSLPLRWMGALGIVVVVAAGCGDSGSDPVAPSSSQTSEDEPDERENEPDENERENQPDENEPDENEPDESEQGAGY